MREGVAGKGVLNPFKGLKSASYSDANNMITLTFSNGNSMYLNTKAGRAQQALEGLLKDVQHISTQSTYDVAAGPGYNDVTGPKLFQSSGTVFAADFTESTGNAVLAYADGVFSITLTGMGGYTSATALNLQIISDITATLTYSTDSSEVQLSGFSVVTMAENDGAILLSYAVDIAALDTAPAADDTITIPDLVVIDPSTGESLTIDTQTYTFTA